MTHDCDASSVVEAAGKDDADQRRAAVAGRPAGPC